MDPESSQSVAPTSENTCKVNSTQECSLDSVQLPEIASLGKTRDEDNHATNCSKGLCFLASCWLESGTD